MTVGGGERVKVAVEVPAGIQVGRLFAFGGLLLLRNQVYDRIQAEKARAAGQRG